MQIAKHKVVTIDYTLTDADKNVLDSSEGREPLSYLHGTGRVIPGLESALEGKSAGEELAVTIPPEEAYGQRNEMLVQEVSRGQFETVPDLAVGMQFQAQTMAGPRVITVVEVENDKVTVDGNHALAGMSLNFNINVVEVRDATAEEISHGHVHGPGGHHH